MRPFLTGRFYGKWTRFAFKVTAENVTLYLNCNETETLAVKKDPAELVFDSASTLYIAQAGPTLGEPYEVSDLIRLRFLPVCIWICSVFIWSPQEPV